MQEIQRAFQENEAGKKVIFNFAASGILAQQILQGAPVDIFISASKEQSKLLESRLLVSPGDIADYAGNRLVLVCAGKRNIKDLSELKSFERIAIGNPRTVPAGAYAEQALKKAGVYHFLTEGSRLVLAEDARQILTYVEGADVEAGLVYNTDASLSPKLHVAYSVPEADTQPIRYQICLLKSSSEKELARRFRNFLLSERARAILRKRGFFT